MTVLVQRESAGPDDEGSPLRRMFDVPEAIGVGEFLARVREAPFLPHLPGGRATWLCEGDLPLAVLAQEYRNPWPLLRSDTPLVEVAARLPRPHLLLRHFGHRSTEDVFREHGGDPVRLPKEAWEPSAEISWSEAFRLFFKPRR